MKWTGFYDRLCHYATGKRIAFFVSLFVLMQISMILFVIPVISSYTDQIPLEGRFHYSADDAQDYFVSLSEHGRNVYTVSTVLDTVFAGVYALAFALLLFGLLKRTVRENSVFVALAAVPLLAGICDFLENCILHYSMRSDQLLNHLTGFISAAGLMTKIKICCYIVIILSLMLLGVRLIFILIRDRINERSGLPG